MFKGRLHSLKVSHKRYQQTRFYFVGELFNIFYEKNTGSYIDVIVKTNRTMLMAMSSLEKKSSETFPGTKFLIINSFSFLIVQDCFSFFISLMFFFSVFIAIHICLSEWHKSSKCRRLAKMSIRAT